MILRLVLVICAAVFVGLVLAFALVALGIGAWAVVGLMFAAAFFMRGIIRR